MLVLLHHIMVIANEIDLVGSHSMLSIALESVMQPVRILSYLYPNRLLDTQVDDALTPLIPYMVFPLSCIPEQTR